MVTCSSSSPNVTSMLWYYHGNQLSNSSKHVITTKKNMSTLRVVNMTRNDFGPYTCKVEDSIHVILNAIGYLNHTSKCSPPLCVIITPTVCHYPSVCHHYPHCVSSLPCCVSSLPLCVSSLPHCVSLLPPLFVIITSAPVPSRAALLHPQGNHDNGCSWYNN